MKTNQHMPEQIIKILDQAAKGDQTVAAVCREHGIAENTFYRWRKTYAWHVRQRSPALEGA